MEFCRPSFKPPGAGDQRQGSAAIVITSFHRVRPLRSYAPSADPNRTDRKSCRYPPGRWLRVMCLTVSKTANRPILQTNRLGATRASTNVKSLGGAIGQPAWRNKPSWYIVVADDRAISPKLEATMAQAIHATTETIKASHVAMLSHPRELADVIERAAGH
ncbi:alpha/beta hydrolase [Burkholderia sp. GS2Y]|uniref:Alpha/beta hydrolase n=1 Tax=Burkholderia theae TaxID=3143496 RepID=A0ABU9WTV6_9BURK